MKQLIFVIGLSCLSTGWSQQKKDSIFQPRFILKLAHGLMSEQNFRLSSNYWNENFTNLPLPNSDSTSYSQGLGSFSVAPSVYLSADFPLKQFGKKGGLLVRASFGLGPKVVLNHQTIFTKDEGIIDTLHSSLTNTDTYVTLESSESYSISSNYQTFQFGTGIFYSTNLERFFAFQTGLAAHYGVGLVNELTGTYMKSYATYGGAENQSYDAYFPASTQSEQRVTKNKAISNILIQMPLEMSVRLGRKPNFASRMRLGMEFNPGMNMTFFNGVRHYKFSFSHYLSLRVLL